MAALLPVAQLTAPLAILAASLFAAAPAPPVELVPPASALVFDGEVFAARLADAITAHTRLAVRVKGEGDTPAPSSGPSLVVSLISGIQLCRLVVERTEAGIEPSAPIELATARCAELRAEGLDYAAFAKLLFPDGGARERGVGDFAVTEEHSSSGAPVAVVLASVGAVLTAGGLVAVLVGLNAVDDPPHPFDYESQRDTQKALLIGGGSGLAAGVGLITAAVFAALAE